MHVSSDFRPKGRKGFALFNFLKKLNISNVCKSDKDLS
jgi:hypothetical protein